MTVSGATTGMVLLFRCVGLSTELAGVGVPAEVVWFTMAHQYTVITKNDDYEASSGILLIEH